MWPTSLPKAHFRADGFTGDTSFTFRSVMMVVWRRVPGRDTDRNSNTFAHRQPVYASIGDQVWVDTNSDVRDTQAKWARPV